MAIWITKRARSQPGALSLAGVYAIARPIGLGILCLTSLSSPAKSADASLVVSPVVTSAREQKEEIPKPDCDELAAVRILAKFKPQFMADAAGRLMALEYLAARGLRLEREYRLVPGLVRLERSTMVDLADAPPPTLERQIKALRESGMFEYVEPDRPVRTAIEPDCNTATDGERFEER